MARLAASTARFEPVATAVPMPPRSCLAQKVTVRPRSAAASMWARWPLMTTSGSGLASWSATQESSPSPTSKFEPPPRN